MRINNMEKQELLKKYMDESLKDIKISQKEMAIEIGVNTRSIRTIKKDNIERYKLVEDALKYRKIIGELDIKIKRVVIDAQDEFWIYDKDKKMLGIDLKIKSIKIETNKNPKIPKPKFIYSAKRGDEDFILTQKEFSNLMRTDIMETTISDVSIRVKLKDMELFL
jgi:DNA-binding XRE family transcriptional regulator